jgi:hypothetical protein
VQQANGNQIRFREVDQEGNPAEPDTVTHHREHDGRSAGRTPFNPFIVILWILAAVLVAGGIWGFLNAASMLGPPSPGTMALSFALINYAPMGGPKWNLGCDDPAVLACGTVAARQAITAQC